MKYLKVETLIKGPWNVLFHEAITILQAWLSDDLPIHLKEKSSRFYHAYFAEFLPFASLFPVTCMEWRKGSKEEGGEGGETTKTKEIRNQKNRG